MQASINNERDFDRVAEPLIIQHPRIHPRDSHRSAKSKGKDGFECEDNSNLRWFRGKGKGKHTGRRKIGKAGTSAHYDSYTSVEDYGFDDEHG